MIRDLAAAIIRDGKVPSDWEQSFIVCLYKGKGDTLERDNYRGLKLTEQVMKMLEKIVDGLIRQLVSIDDSKFGFLFLFLWFPLPLGVWEGLRFVIVALPGLFSYLYFRPRQRYCRRNFCCQAAAREVSSCQQETLHGFHRPGEGV